MALTREQLAQRVAKELQDGFYVNLGIGIPTLVSNYIPQGMQVMLQSGWRVILFISRKLCDDPWRPRRSHRVRRI